MIEILGVLTVIALFLGVGILFAFVAEADSKEEVKDCFKAAWWLPLAGLFWFISLFILPVVFIRRWWQSLPNK